MLKSIRLADSPSLFVDTQDWRNWVRTDCCENFDAYFVGVVLVSGRLMNYRNSPGREHVIDLDIPSASVEAQVSTIIEFDDESDHAIHRIAGYKADVLAADFILGGFAFSPR